MSNAVQNLIQELAEWRKHRSSAEVSPRSSNPYGVKIYDLNMQWARTREEHAKALEAQRTQYLEQREKLTELSARWKADNPTPKLPTGRPATPYPDALKIAAARALQEGTTKTAIRGILGIGSTEKLDAILTEGAALIEAEEESK